MDENIDSESSRISNKVYNLLYSHNNAKNRQNEADEKLIMEISSHALREIETELNKGVISPCRAALNVGLVIEHMHDGAKEKLSPNITNAADTIFKAIKDNASEATIDINKASIATYMLLKFIREEEKYKLNNLVDAAGAILDEIKESIYRKEIDTGKATSNCFYDTLRFIPESMKEKLNEKIEDVGKVVILTELYNKNINPKVSVHRVYDLFRSMPESAKEELAYMAIDLGEKIIDMFKAELESHSISIEEFEDKIYILVKAMPEKAKNRIMTRLPENITQGVLKHFEMMPKTKELLLKEYRRSLLSPWANTLDY